MDNRGHVISFDDSPLTANNPIKSVDYNEIINSLKGSVLRSINKYREMNTKQSQYIKALTAENALLSSKLVDIQSFAPLEDNTTIITGYDAQESSANINTDRLAGQVTVGYDRKWSKVARYTDINGKRRPTKDTYISLDGNPLAQSDTIYNILDGNRETFWLLDTAPGAVHEIVIQFPSSIRPYVNMLTLTPFPAFGFSLDKVYARQADGTQHDVTPQGYQAATMNGVETHFSPTSWANEVTIRFTAAADTVGISNLDLFLIDYFDSEATVKYEIPAFEGVEFDHIAEVDLMNFGLHGLEDGNGTWDRYKKITVTAFVNSTNAGNILPATLKGQETTQLSVMKNIGDKFYLQFTFGKNIGQSPVFRSARVKYETYTP